MKPKLAMYWAASCGGCEVALLNLSVHLLDFERMFDFVFCPCLLDTKTEAIERMDDGAIAITLFNGAIRTSENEAMARLLRRKSAAIVAFGSCAGGGCIPALGNLATGESHLREVYLDGASVDNPEGVLPREVTEMPEGTLRLPVFQARVRNLEQVVEVDYHVPGCPPESERIWEVLEVLARDPAEWPARGSVLGAGASTVCRECARTRQSKAIPRFYRNYEIVPNPTECLLDQGLVCLGIATREGCGALCPQVNMPCTGCYGSTGDQGAAMTGALGSALDTGGYKGLDAVEIRRRAGAIAETIPDPAGSFYRYSMAASRLGGRR